MATITWKGTSDDWTDAAAWFRGAVPAVTDDAVFPGGDAYVTTVAAGENVSAGSVMLGADVLSNSNPTLRIAANGTLSLGGSLTLASGTLDLVGALVGTLTAPSYPQPNTTYALGAPHAVGTLDANGGTILGGISLTDATIHVMGDGLHIVAPRGGHGSITVAHGSLVFDGMQTLDAVQVALEGGSLGFGDLTLGPGTQVTGSSTATLYGTLSTGSGGTMLFVVTPPTHPCRPISQTRRMD